MSDIFSFNSCGANRWPAVSMSKIGHLQPETWTHCCHSVFRLRSGYLLSSGRGARLPLADDQLASAHYLAVAHLGGDANDGRNDNIFLAAPVQLEVLQKHVPGIVSGHVGVQAFLGTAKAIAEANAVPDILVESGSPAQASPWQCWESLQGLFVRRYQPH